MDLLNYQYLDKMNNNIGILCYEGKVKCVVVCGRFDGCCSNVNFGAAVRTNSSHAVFTQVC